MNDVTVLVWAAAWLLWLVQAGCYLPVSLLPACNSICFCCLHVQLPVSLVLHVLAPATVRACLLLLLLLPPLVRTSPLLLMLLLHWLLLTVVCVVALFALLLTFLLLIFQACTAYGYGPCLAAAVYCLLLLLISPQLNNSSTALFYCGHCK